MNGLTEEQLQVAGILSCYQGEWSGREMALAAPDLLINLSVAYVGVEKVRTLGHVLVYAHTYAHTGRKRKIVVDVEKLVDLWVEVLVALSVAHDHADRSAADERTDDLLGPLLTCPVKQLREFAQTLAARLKADERVPFLVWSTFERLIAPLILLGPEGKTVALKTTLATEIAEMVEKDLNRGELIASMAAALQWRSPETLEKVKTGLRAGAKPRLRGGESCLFLHIVEDGGAEVAQVVL